ncbi:uncharacterized protein LOC128669772 [Plodia interpunctella]|uniref:uncharacterized protein LOC128669772 n=1 Tax=Plodia interpunctella TaxID=58824 RepID=UPI0023679A7C|nr:uncharacterized protein LOC128669772 [Plodia interpunctella]
MGVQEKVVLLLLFYTITCVVICMPRSFSQSSLTKYLSNSKQTDVCDAPKRVALPLGKLKKAKRIKYRPYHTLKNNIRAETPNKMLSQPEAAYPLKTKKYFNIPESFSDNNGVNNYNPSSNKTALFPTLKKYKKQLNKNKANHTENINKDVPKISPGRKSDFDAFCFKDIGTFPEVEYPIFVSETWAPKFWNNQPFYEKKKDDNTSNLLFSLTNSLHKNGNSNKTVASTSQDKSTTCKLTKADKPKISTPYSSDEANKASTTHLIPLSENTLVPASDLLVPSINNFNSKSDALPDAVNNVVPTAETSPNLTDVRSESPESCEDPESDVSLVPVNNLDSKSDNVLPVNNFSPIAETPSIFDVISVSDINEALGTVASDVLGSVSDIPTTDKYALPTSADNADPTNDASPTNPTTNTPLSAISTAVHNTDTLSSVCCSEYANDIRPAPVSPVVSTAYILPAFISINETITTPSNSVNLTPDTSPVPVSPLVSFTDSLPTLVLSKSEDTVVPSTEALPTSLDNFFPSYVEIPSPTTDIVPSSETLSEPVDSNVPSFEDPIISIIDALTIPAYTVVPITDDFPTLDESDVTSSKDLPTPVDSGVLSTETLPTPNDSNALSNDDLSTLAVDDDVFLIDAFPTINKNSILSSMDAFSIPENRIISSTDDLPGSGDSDPSSDISTPVDSVTSSTDSSIPVDDIMPSTDIPFTPVFSSKTDRILSTEVNPSSEEDRIPSSDDCSSPISSSEPPISAIPISDDRSNAKLSSTPLNIVDIPVASALTDFDGSNSNLNEDMFFQDITKSRYLESDNLKKIFDDKNSKEILENNWICDEIIPFPNEENCEFPTNNEIYNMITKNNYEDPINYNNGTNACEFSDSITSSDLTHSSYVDNNNHKYFYHSNNLEESDDVRYSDRTTVSPFEYTSDINSYSDNERDNFSPVSTDAIIEESNILNDNIPPDYVFKTTLSDENDYSDYTTESPYNYELDSNQTNNIPLLIDDGTEENIFYNNYAQADYNTMHVLESDTFDNLNPTNLPEKNNISDEKNSIPSNLSSATDFNNDLRDEKDNFTHIPLERMTENNYRNESDSAANINPHSSSEDVENMDVTPIDLTNDQQIPESIIPLPIPENIFTHSGSDVFTNAEATMESPMPIFEYINSERPDDNNKYDNQISHMQVQPYMSPELYDPYTSKAMAHENPVFPGSDNFMIPSFFAKAIESPRLQTLDVMLLNFKFD